MFNSYNQKIDSGDIILKAKMEFKGNELNEEIRDKQARYSIELIKKFLKIYPKYKLKKQIGTPSYFRKRNAADSLIDINKSIKKQFNLFRICDNKNYPAYFIYKSNKYLLKIYKDKFYEKKKDKSSQIIDQIQKIRTKNNVNWMNLLRLAFKKILGMLQKF